MTTRRLHEIRRLRRELRAANEAAAKYAAMVATPSLASAFLDIAAGSFLHALTQAIRPKRKPEPLPAVVSTFTGATTVKP